MGRIILLIITLFFCLLANAEDIEEWKEYQRHDKEMRKTILNRVFDYTEKHANVISDSIYRDAYMKLDMDIERRNIALLAVPDMYKFLRGERHFTAEEQLKVFNHTQTEVRLEKVWEKSTFYNHSVDVNFLAKNYHPNFYNEAVFGRDAVLSPFRKCNRLFYKYEVIHSNKSTRLYFRPFQKHTSLIDGMAEIDSLTGRIKFVHFNGEYDLFNFQTDMTMNLAGEDSIVRMNVDFHFLGNKINSQLEIASPPALSASPPGLSPSLPSREGAQDSTLNSKLSTLNSQPTTLHFSLKNIGDVAWGDTRTQSGNTSLKLSPLLNPFMMSYSQSKGLAYKLEFNLTHKINENQLLGFDAKLGYNFKQKQLYINIPLRWVYNINKEGSILAEYTSGNRMVSSVVTEFLNYLDIDSLKDEDVEYFIDNHIKLANTYRLSNNLLSTIGASYHRRYAVNPEYVELFGGRSHYNNFAPYMSLTYRFPHQGPVMRLDYEQGIENVLGSFNSFSRIELDATYKHKLRSIRTLSLRAGAGCYLAPDGYVFMDYENFRDNNLPEGWNDDWTGEFQMLSSYQYNISKYYLRGNVTYESPLLALYWLPFVGRYIETERIYFNVLEAKAMHPYMEVGYGIKNKLFSSALYANFNNFKYKGIEFKIILELFNH